MSLCHKVQPLPIDAGRLYSLRPLQGTVQRTFPFQRYHFFERRVFATTFQSVDVEGVDAVLHKGCFVFLPAQGINIPLCKYSPKPWMKVKHVDNVGLVAQMSGQTWYHLLTECLPRLLLLLPLLPPGASLIVPPAVPSLRNALTLLANWTGPLLHTSARVRYKASKLTTVDWRATYAPAHGPSTDFCAPRAALQLLRTTAWGAVGLQSAVLGNDQTRWPPRMIYVSRADAKTRDVNNEKDLLHHLNVTAKQCGVALEIFRGSEKSLQDTIRLFSNIRLVIGPHGSGLANIAFCRPNTPVIEIGLPNTQDLIFYAHLSAALELDYHYLVASPLTEGDTASGLRGSIVVNIQDAVMLTATSLVQHGCKPPSND